MRAQVIAECGSCHGGSLIEAYKLIEIAHEAGANIAKFQYWSSAERMAVRRNAAEYREIYQRYQVPRAWLPLLRQKCDREGIRFACSVYLPEDVWAVAEHADIVKVASFEANDESLLLACRAVLAAEKRIIVSLGMGASAETVRGILRENSLVGDSTAHELPLVLLMHCVSAYPAPIDQLNLRRIGDWRHGWPVFGYSDHSPSDELWSGAIAVAKGAIAIERHVKAWYTSADNPDAPHAMTPKGFTHYIQNIRHAERMLGETDHGAMPCEDAMSKYRVWGHPARSRRAIAVETPNG